MLEILVILSVLFGMIVLVTLALIVLDRNSIKNQIGKYNIYYVDHRDEMDEFPDNTAFFVVHGDILYFRIHHDDERIQRHVVSWFSKENIREEFLRTNYVSKIPSGVTMM